MAQIVLSEGAAAATPSANTVSVYAKTDGKVYSKDDAGTEYDLTSAGVSDGDKGDITVTSSGTVWTIDNNVVSNAKLADVATATIKGRTTAGTGDPEDLTATQATALLNAMVGDSGAGGTKGLVPAPAAGDAAAGKFLKADGTWTATGGGGVSDGDKGDITVSGSGATWTIDNDVVTYAKMQNVSATSRVLGRKTAGAGDTEECTLSEVLDFIGSAAQGDILYRDASAWARLAAGTSGYYLKTQGAGANPTWAAVSGTATITLGTPQATTSGTSIDFTSIPSGTKMIVIAGIGISTNGTDSFLLQLGDSGGVENTGYSGVVSYASTATLSSSAGYQITDALVAAQVYDLYYILVLENAATFTWGLSGKCQHIGATPQSPRNFCGNKSLSAALDRIRLTTTGGINTFDAGEINILYFG